MELCIKLNQIFVAHLHQNYRFLTHRYFKILPVFLWKTGKSESIFETHHEIFYDMYSYFYSIEF